MIDQNKDSLNATDKMLSYLAQIYRLSATVPADAYVSTSAVAEMLDVSPPAVNRMISKLRDLGLLEHEPYQGIRLTEAGRRSALQQLRYQRIAECFLVAVMGFTWDQVHQEARRMSVAMSEALTQRMWEMAGKPTTCPHGEPIPSADGDIPALDDILLSDGAAGQHYRITRVLTREPDRLRYLDALHLRPQTTLEIIHIAPFNGPLQLRLENEYRIIGHNLAELIRVVPLP